MGGWAPVLVFLVPAVLVPTLLVAVFLPLQADAEYHSSYTSASCFRKETYNTTSTVKVQIPVNKTRYDWCLGGFMRCMVYKVEMAEKEINVTEIRSRIVEMCCPGMIPAPGTPAQSTNESLQCIPAPGSATPPVATSATTIETTTPREVCKTGLWGRGCSYRCLCNGAPCDQDTGVCKPCPPNDQSCALSTVSTTSTSTSTSTTTTTIPVPTTRSTTPSTTTSTTPSTTTTTPLTTPSTTTSTTMISTLATTKAATQRSVETSPVSPSNAPDIPVAASTESPHTVSTTGLTARLAEFTTVRPVVVTREHAAIDRRKEAPGKSMAQPAKTTAQPIDPEAVNHVDISPGNGKPKPDSLPTNTSSITTLPPTNSTTPQPTSSSTHPTYPISPSTFSVLLTTIPKTSTTITTTTSKSTLATQVLTTSTTSKPVPKQITSKTNDSSEESDSDEGDDDDDDDEGEDDDDDEEDLEDKEVKTTRQETILSPPGKPATRIDKIQTKINGSQHLMTWTFQTDFSVGPPVKYGTPPPRNNAISPSTETRSSSAPALDKNTDDKIGAMAVTYGVKPWMPALNLATEAPRFNEQTTRQNHDRTSFDKPTTILTSMSSPTASTSTTTHTISTSTTQASTQNSSTRTPKIESSTEALKTSSTTDRITTSSTATTPADAATTAANQNKTNAPIQSTSTQTSSLTSIVTGTFRTIQSTSTSTLSTPTIQHIHTEPNQPTSVSSSRSSTSVTTPSLSSTSSSQIPTSKTPSSTSPTSTTLKVPSVTIPAEPPPVSVQTVSTTVQTTSSTLGQTTLQGHIDEPMVSVNKGFSVQYSVTSPRPVHNISQLGSPPMGSPPNSPSASETSGAAVAAVAITLAVLAICCVLTIFVQTRKKRSKRRSGVAPPPSPPLISAWHSVPHYSETFAATAVPASTQLTSPSQPTPHYSDQFEQPAVEHVYQEITPLANVTETSTHNQPTVTSAPQQDTGPTKVMVKLRNVETYTVVR